MSSEESNGVVLELNEFCIETTTKQVYRKLVDQSLENDEIKSGDQEAIEILRTFLEQEDFSSIRAANQDLCGGKNVRIRIFRDKKGKICWSRRV